MWISMMWLVLMPFWFLFLGSFGFTPMVLAVAFLWTPIAIGAGCSVAAVIALARHRDRREHVVVAVNAGLVGALPALVVLLLWMRPN